MLGWYPRMGTPDKEARRPRVLQLWNGDMIFVAGRFEREVTGLRRFLCRSSGIRGFVSPFKRTVRAPSDFRYAISRRWEGREAGNTTEMRIIGNWKQIEMATRRWVVCVGLLDGVRSATGNLWEMISTRWTRVNSVDFLRSFNMILSRFWKSHVKCTELCEAGQVKKLHYAQFQNWISKILCRHFWVSTVIQIVKIGLKKLFLVKIWGGQLKWRQKVNRISVTCLDVSAESRESETDSLIGSSSTDRGWLPVAATAEDRTLAFPCPYTSKGAVWGCISMVQLFQAFLMFQCQSTQTSHILLLNQISFWIHRRRN
jgi:hypothetical protein